MHDFPILYVEDEQADVLFLQQAFIRAGITNPLQVLPDGQQTLAYLAGQGEFSDRNRYPLPALVLLDLNLPQMSGFDVLRWIRAQPRLRRILVLVWSSSLHPPDMDRAYDLGANGFVIKPPNLNQLVEMAKAIRDYWLVFNQPPQSFG